MKKAISSALLAALLLTSLAACGGQPSGAPETGESASVTAETTTTAFDKLPAGLDYAGAKLNVCYRGSDSVTDYDVLGKENTGDIVYDAIWNRNSAVENRLGLSFSFTAAPASYADANTFFKTHVLSGSSDFDVIWTTGNTMVVHGLNNFFRDLRSAEYLDLDADWWNREAMLEMSVDGETLSFLYGAPMLVGLRQTGCMYFNKNMYKDFYGDPNALYADVLDGKWTLDKLETLSKDVYKDLDGNGKVDEATDRFSFMYSKYDEETLLHFVYSTDIATYRRESSGRPIITFNDTRVYSIADRFTKLCANKFVVKSAYSYTDPNIYDAFGSGRTLFLPERFYASTLASLRGMEQEYGMIPYPKADDSQEDYINLIHNSGTTAAVPLSVSDERFEMAGAALEALASEQFRTVLPAFYEVALKTKYSRDEASGQVIDLLYGISAKNLLSEYSTVMNGFYYKIVTCIRTGEGYASVYDANVKAAQTALDELYNTVTEK